MAVYNWGPGATAQEQQTAASVMNRHNQPYMGFGEHFGQQPNVYNWQMTPDKPAPSFGLWDKYTNSALAKQGMPFEMWQQQYLQSLQQPQQAAPKPQPQPDWRAEYRNRPMYPQQQQSASPPPAPSSPSPTPPAAPAPAPATAPIDWQPFLDQLSGIFGGGGSGSGFGAAPPQINVTSGITAGPVYTQPMAQAAQNTSRRMTTRPLGLDEAFGVPMGDAARSSLTGSYGTAASNAARIAGTDLGRDIDYANAQHLLASEKARASSGIDWGNLGAREYELGLFKDLSGRNRQLSLLDAITGLLL